MAGGATWWAVLVVLLGCGEDGGAVRDGGGAPGDAAVDAASAEDAGPLDPAVVETTEGPVRGVRSGDAWSFLGIPYAAPPVGPARFRPAEPAVVRDEELVADAYGDACMHVPYGGTGPIGSEDCLYLNVWTPAERDQPLPVMVWLHGGDNLIGSGNDYDGTFLSVTGHAVVVTINYRLGAFGWLAHPAFGTENPEGATGNWGLHDALEALRWVRRNIDGFGGDPERVMVFGQSAGASNTCALLSSPLAEGLLSRALMQSLWCHVVPDETIALTNASAVTDLGCSEADDVAACLRAAPAEDLATVPGAVLGTDGGDYYVVVDGWSVPEPPERALEAGRHHHVPIVLGTTADEYSQLVDLIVDGPLITPEDFERTVRELFGDELAEDLLALYPLDVYAIPRWGVAAMISDYIMHCPTGRAARGAAASQEEPVYRYVFGHGYDDRRIRGAGAAHGYDVGYVFHDFDDIAVTEAERALSREVIGYWSRFAATGDPNGEGAFEWPTYGDDERYLRIDFEPSVGSGWRTVECDFWDMHAE